MKQIYLAFALIAWSANFEAVQEQCDNALRAGHIKEAESLYNNFLKTAEDKEIGYAKSRLAITYYKDQEHEKAFKTFLEALEISGIKESSAISSGEKKVYEEALKIYLDNEGLTAEEKAQKIALQFGPIYEKNPDFYSLGYIIAVGQANQGHYEQFFDLFYKSYLKDPHHFLAYKAKAALHIKLFERAKIDVEREEQRKQIIDNAHQATLLYPRDSSLYRMILGFTPEASKGKILFMYLNKIIEENIVISRTDIPYYVEIAIAFEQYDLAQNFLDKAQNWYAYSRVISAAQQRLDEATPVY